MAQFLVNFGGRGDRLGQFFANGSTEGMAQALSGLSHGILTHVQARGHFRIRPMLRPFHEKSAELLKPRAFSG